MASKKALDWKLLPLGVAATLAAAGCSAPVTSLLVDLALNVSVSAPASLNLSVFDDAHALAIGRQTTGRAPGQLRISGLATQAATLRLVLLDGASNKPMGWAITASVPDGETRVAVVLRDDLPDTDGDAVPDPVDNCPNRSNPEQLASEACVPPFSADTDAGSGSGSDAGAVVDAGADAARAACSALFCDDFEHASVSGGSVIEDGAPTFIGATTQHASISVDPTRGAQGTHTSLRLDVKQSPGDLGGSWDAEAALLGLYPGVPHFDQLRTGPTYVRAFVRFSKPPSTFNGVTLGRLWFGGESDNVELDAANDGLKWTLWTHFDNPSGFGASSFTVDWVNDWVCLEWEHRLLPVDASSSRTYVTKVTASSPSGAVLGSASGSGTAAQTEFGGFMLANVVTFAPGTPDTQLSMWADQVRIDNHPIGCASH